MKINPGLGPKIQARMLHPYRILYDGNHRQSIHQQHHGIRGYTVLAKRNAPLPRLNPDRSQNPSGGHCTRTIESDFQVLAGSAHPT